jgi:hypothetical protein
VYSRNEAVDRGECDEAAEARGGELTLNDYCE